MALLTLHRSGIANAATPAIPFPPPMHWSDVDTGGSAGGYTALDFALQPRAKHKCFHAASRSCWNIILYRVLLCDVQSL